MPTHATEKKPIDVLILIAPEFEGGGLFFCLEKLRSKGYATVLASLTSGLIEAKHGYAVKSDMTLTELLKYMKQCHLILIPGGRNSTKLLMNDPRVHRLLHKVNAAGGSLALFRSAESMLSSFIVANSFQPNRYLPQKGVANNHFVQQIESLLLKRLPLPR